MSVGNLFPYNKDTCIYIIDYRTYILFFRMKMKMTAYFSLLLFLRSHMQEGLYQNYTVQSLLNKLDILKCFGHHNSELRVGEVFTKQKNYEALGITPPV